MLQDAGSEGVSNMQFIEAKVSLRAAARVHELRNDGWEIRTKTEKNDEARYVLVGRQ